MSERVKLRIDRKRWRRGETSELLDGYGRMCCLGFACEAAGVEVDAMLWLGEPYELGDWAWVPKVSEVWRWLFSEENTRSFVGVNDAKAMDDSEREGMLSEMFAERGINVEFYEGEAGA